MSDKDDREEAKRKEAEEFRQRQIGREESRVYKFYRAAQPYKEREPKIKKLEALSELTKMRGSLTFKESIEYCDEAIQRLKEQILEEEKDDGRDDSTS